jgi:hypothetical protein
LLRQRTRNPAVEAAVTVDAQNASTVPWKTRQTAFPTASTAIRFRLTLTRILCQSSDPDPVSVGRLRLNPGDRSC